MKIQTLFSLAAVGLTFANPIHSLEERGPITDIAKCVGDTVKQGLGDVCEATEVCDLLGGQEGLTSCITNAVVEVTNIAELTQNPLGWLQSLDCSKELLGGVEDPQELQDKLQKLPQRLTHSVAGIIANGAKCLSLE
ncbi:hypothetical protein BDV33DRAFT_99706 [Aspergillus novoparasiticus]|uniref:Uncharacterized protein n=1 Tax=Aspergillus novoparasiticus TaxID=986946 RepID=A0A5N6ETW8_9EURO|nr:hypothetical protein BDV33DRAFT_99706 [Aspergillus novoparasiticus]